MTAFSFDFEVVSALPSGVTASRMMPVREPLPFEKWDEARKTVDASTAEKPQFVQMFVPSGFWEARAAEQAASGSRNAISPENAKSLSWQASKIRDLFSSWRDDLPEADRDWYFLTLQTRTPGQGGWGSDKPAGVTFWVQKHLNEENMLAARSMREKVADEAAKRAAKAAETVAAKKAAKKAAEAAAPAPTEATQPAAESGTQSPEPEAPAAATPADEPEAPAEADIPKKARKAA